MIRDRLLKLFAIPLLGFFIPLLSRFTDFSLLSNFQLIISFFLFVGVSWCLWQGSVWIIYNIRNSWAGFHLVTKLSAIVVFIIAYNALLVFAFSLLWQVVFTGALQWPPVWRTFMITSIASVFFSLVYEILFLSKEREIDNQVIDHLNKELMHAEVNVLKNELDPHFVYNTLMPLYYLVKNDVQKAEQFAYKLIQVYQYFLENRQNDFISLKEELDFIENYFFLLRIRYKDSISLNVKTGEDAEGLMILPFSLQILVENAIKHNRVRQDEPLEITVAIERGQLVVSNLMHNKAAAIYSPKIGLKNLRTRYRLLCNNDVAIIKHRDLFIVKVPLINNSKPYDLSSYNRR